ncbi:MAG: response regulator [Chloroflexi bacterium]|nr:response regulator [Chloroflexota bacterium]
MTELMTLEEVAGYLRVNEKTVYRMVSEGSIPALKIGHLWRFKKSVIDDWLDQKARGTSARILVIDDDEGICSLVQDTLEGEGHEVAVATEAIEGLKLAKSQDFDMIFLDLKMPGMDGAELFRQIRTVKPNQPVTIITGFPGSELMKAALAYGPVGIMKKPFGESDIITVVNSCLRCGTPAKQKPARKIAL